VVSYGDVPRHVVRLGLLGDFRAAPSASAQSGGKGQRIGMKWCGTALGEFFAPRFERASAWSPVSREGANFSEKSQLGHVHFYRPRLRKLERRRGRVVGGILALTLRKLTPDSGNNIYLCKLVDEIRLHAVWVSSDTPISAGYFYARVPSDLSFESNSDRTLLCPRECSHKASAFFLQSL
jgi:hypothetical protein